MGEEHWRSAMRFTLRTIWIPLAGVFLAISAASAQPAAPPARQAPEVPYLPTTQAGVEAMLKLAQVTDKDVVYDLGCGDGRIVITAAKLYGARGVGIDIDPQRIREATVVTLFLLTSVNARLRPKLLDELRVGTRVVSNTFDMGDWKPEKEFTVDSGDDGYFSKKLYLWTIPLRR